MWRRVLSQSPTEVPENTASRRQTRKYLDGWKALGALLHGGGALSGHERNVCFLNTHGKRFADASSAIGFDHDADTRGIAAVDWDGDGDLDILTANRTAPRARYLQNNLDRERCNSVQIRLRGTKVNRDAIGAKVAIRVQNSATPIVRTLSAGEGFVSQSTKWLHFGLGADKQIVSVDVRWPGGETEVFRGVEANGRYVLTEGVGVAEPLARATTNGFAEVLPLEASPSPNARIVLSRRVPMPRIVYRDLRGESKALPVAKHPTLIHLWATWCAPCLHELGEWNRQQAVLGSLRIVALNVDGLDATNRTEASVENVSKVWEQMGLPFECGAIDPNAFEMLEVVERTLLLQQAPLPIPTSFLIDEDGRLAIVYKGPVSAHQLHQDVLSLEASVADVRHPATPFPGKWYSSPFPPDLLAIPSLLVGLGRGGHAFEYIDQHLAPGGNRDGSAWEQLGITEAKLLGVLEGTARLLQQDQRPEDAAKIYQIALQYVPQSWSTGVAYSSLLMQLDRSASALAVNRRLATIRPNHPLPLNNIAWILATSTDDSVRNPARAITLAKQLCDATRNEEPSPLDTLAVAYAANGDLPNAIAASKLAIAAATNLGRHELVTRIQARLDSFSAELEQNR